MSSPFAHNVVHNIVDKLYDGGLGCCWDELDREDQRELVSDLERIVDEELQCSEG